MRQNSTRKQTFFARQFNTLYEQKFSNLTPLLPLHFPKDSENLKKFKYWTLESGGKKTFKQSEQTKKISKKNFLAPRRFYTLYGKKLANLRQLQYITFPKGFRRRRKKWTFDFGKLGQKDR